MNTKISYMYRDADNYKTWNEEVLKGEISAQQLMTIVDCLEDKMYFIPSQVGLPEVRFDDVTEADHCWFELCPEQDFSTTAHEPTIDMTVDKLVERFQAAKGRWDDESLLGIAAERPDEEMEADEDGDGEYIIAVEAVIQHSGKRVTGILPARIVGVSGEDAMHEKVDSLVREGYQVDGIHVFFAKDEIK